MKLDEDIGCGFQMPKTKKDKAIYTGTHTLANLFQTKD